jgi:hypothetical protein
VSIPLHCRQSVSEQTGNSKTTLIETTQKVPTSSALRENNTSCLIHQGEQLVQALKHLPSTDILISAIDANQSTQFKPSLNEQSSPQPLTHQIVKFRGRTNGAAADHEGLCGGCEEDQCCDDGFHGFIYLGMLWCCSKKN